MCQLHFNFLLAKAISTSYTHSQHTLFLKMSPMGSNSDMLLLLNQQLAMLTSYQARKQQTAKKWKKLKMLSKQWLVRCRYYLYGSKLGKDLQQLLIDVEFTVGKSALHNGNRYQKICRYPSFFLMNYIIKHTAMFITYFSNHET